MNYTIKQDNHPSFKALQLRYRVFVEELDWVDPNPTRVEIDRYDEHAISFTAYPANSIIPVGYFRLLSSQYEFMVWNEFPQVLPPRFVQRNDDYEISRFCVDPDLTSKEKIKVTKDLVRALFIFGTTPGKELTYYSVVTLPSVRMWRKYGPCHIVKESGNLVLMRVSWKEWCESGKFHIDPMEAYHDLHSKA